MSTKTKLISTISVFCMVLAMLVTGVWAVSTANITLGGTVSFTADNVNAVITGSITGIQETVDIKPLTYTAKTQPEQAELNSWNNNVSFDSGNLITMTITVQNKSTERSLFVTVTDNTTTTNINKDFSSTVNNVGSGDTYEVVAGGEIEYTLTLSVDELDYSASATYALDVDLRDANAEYVPNESDYPYLTFVYRNGNSSGTELEVSAQSITAENANIVIPEIIMKDGKKCTVTVINAELFMQNNILESIVLPSTIVTIEDNAFYGCSNLTSVTLHATNPPELVSGGSTFQNTHANLIIYIPAGSKDLYSADFLWGNSGLMEKLVEMN